MKSIGQLVEAWRTARGMKVAAFAQLVGTSRQNIENLEAGGIGVPRYVAKLARAMGYASVDDLLAGKEPPQAARHEVREGRPPYPGGAPVVALPAAAIDVLGALKKLATTMQHVPAPRRAELGAALNAWALAGGRESHIPLLLEILDPPAEASGKLQQQ